MNKKKIKLFRILTVLMSLAMLLNSSSMTVLATGTGDFFDDPEELVISPLSNSYGNLVYELDENGNAIITGNTITEDTDLVIPSEIDGHKVISIGSMAFFNCNNLTSITIPDGVISIGQSAFGRCFKLTSINIPDGVTSIEISTFAQCRSLTSIKIPDGVTSIGRSAFGNCSSLASVNIPDGVTSIEWETFCSCTNLTSINIPDSVTSIAQSAFYGCESLTSINIPNGVTSIERLTFAVCKNLTSIIIPESVNRIEDNAFDGDDNLTIYGIVGSYAEEWAKSHGINFLQLEIKISEISLDKTSLDLSVNDSEKLTATIKPDDATNKAVNWTSTNTKVATVDADGLVKALGTGRATITVTAADEGGASATCEVTVTQPVTEITLDKTSLNLSVGNSETLTAIVKPDNASDKEVNWTSTNTKVATVDASGLVKAVGAGSATITATAADGSGVKATCKVTVVKLVSEITLDKTDLLLHVGESDSINATVAPADASNKEITWNSTNTEVATVDSTGKVTAVGAGTATITATAADESGISASATIKVTKLVTDVFDDVKSTDWFVKSVQYVYDHGIMAGTNGGKSFSPSGKLTREQFTQVLYAYEGKPEVTNMSGFSDVDANAWYAKSVYWAKEKGITGGKPNGTFGVGENISRQDLAVMLYTYAKFKGYDLTKKDNALDSFTDKGKVSNYAKDAMKWAVTQGVISGKGNGKVDPIGNATRAECATMIMKLIEKNK